MFEDDLMAAVGLVNKNLQERSGEVKLLQEQQQQLIADRLEASKNQNANTLVVKQAELLSQQKAAQNTAKFAEALGTNMDSSSEIMTKLASEWKDATLDSIDKRKKLAKDLDTKFLDSPIDWVVAQFGMETTIKQAEYASARRTEVGSALNQAQAMTQSVAQTNAAISKVKTDVAITAELEATKSMLDGDLLDQQIKAAGINRQGILDLNNMDLQRLNSLHTGEQIKNQRESIKMARETHALQKQSLRLSIDEHLDRLNKNKLEAEAKTTLLQTVKYGAGVLGHDITGLPDSKVELGLKMLPEYKEYLRIGLTSRSVAYPVISDQAGEAAKTIIDSNAPLLGVQKPLKDLLVGSFSEAARNPQVKINGKQLGHDITKIDQVTNAATQLAVHNAIGMQSEIKQNDGTNIYKPQPLPEIVNASAAARDSALVQKVLAPQLAAGGLQEFQPQQIVSMIKTAIKNKTITHEEGISGGLALFQTAVTLNNRTMNYAGFGLPVQEGYKTRMQHILGTQEVVNLANAVEFKRFMEKEIFGPQTLQLPRAGHE